MQIDCSSGTCLYVGKKDLSIPSTIHSPKNVEDVRVASLFAQRPTLSINSSVQSTAVSPIASQYYGGSNSYTRAVLFRENPICPPRAVGLAAYQESIGKNNN